MIHRIPLDPPAGTIVVSKPAPTELEAAWVERIIATRIMPPVDRDSLIDRDLLMSLRDFEQMGWTVRLQPRWYALGLWPMRLVWRLLMDYAHLLPGAAS